MGWKCDICDTYNEETTKQCYVCGGARSEASIREGKRRAREERILRLNLAILNNVFKYSKIFFVLGLSVSSIALVLLLIMKVSGGKLDDIILNAIQLLRNITENIKLLFSLNVVFAFENIGRELIHEFTLNCQCVIKNMKPLIPTLLGAVIHCFGVNAKNNLVSCYNDMIVPMISLQKDNVLVIKTVITCIVPRVKEIGVYYYELISRLIKHITTIF